MGWHTERVEEISDEMKLNSSGRESRLKGYVVSGNKIFSYGVNVGQCKFAELWAQNIVTML